MRNLTALVFTLSILYISTDLRADSFDKCGIFEMEGHIGLEKKKLLFVINKNAQSEVKVSLSSEVDLTKYINEPVKAQLRILKSCRYKCEGNLLKVIERLDPFATPHNPFYPPIKPLSSETCK